MKAVITRMNRTLFELLSGILIFGVIGQLFAFMTRDRAGSSIGLWIGILTAGVYAYHMWRSLDLGLDLGEKNAVAYMSRQNIIRYVLTVAVLIAVAASEVGNPLWAFLGVMGLKVSAYMHFFTRKISRIFYGEEILHELIIEESAGEQ